MDEINNKLNQRCLQQVRTTHELWGSALLNPLTALGVVTELRGAVLEAEGAENKL